MFNAKIQDKFLSKEEVEQFLNVIQNTNFWEKSSVKFWDDRVISFYNIKSKFGPELESLSLDILSRIKNFIEKEYGLDKNIVTGATSICRWFPGMEQPPHADDMTNTDIKGYDDNAFGCIIYLNEDYTGGKTYYPDYKIEVEPRMGKLAVHPGDTNHIHGVTKIEGNIRYTISCFWKYEV